MRVLFLLVLVSSFALAQREESDVEWQKRHAKVEYNAVPVGQHKLEELAVGQSWRMGMNGPSQLKTEMAILIGEQVIVPGTYRVGVFRSADKDLAFMVEGGTQGEAPQAAPAYVLAKGEVKKADKATKKLEVTMKSDAKSATAVQPAKVTVTYGESQLVAPLSFVGSSTKKAGGWTIDAFSLPADVVEKRIADGKPLPVLAFKKETGDKKNPFHVWNLVVGKDSAELWPAPVSPADAFSGVNGLSAAAMVKATSVKWEEAKDSKPFLELSKAEVAKGKGANLVIQAGKQMCTLSLPEPKIPE
jgi:Protein of unknown function (DUF2911)